MEMPSISDIWDSILDEISYLFSGEWLGDMWEFITRLFENLSEFSPVGTIYGIMMVVLVYAFRKSIFTFVDGMGTAGQIIWYPVFYIFAFVVGYIMGKRVWE